MRVLRLCSVFEAPPGGLPPDAARFDAVGGMQHHTGSLTRELARRGVEQHVVTARGVAPPGTTRTGGTTVRRTGFRLPLLRQLWSLGALTVALSRTPAADVVHAHQGEDLATLPLGLLAARRRRCALVVTLHCSLAHTFTGEGPRAALLRTLGAAIERSVVARADAVITLTQTAAEGARRDGARHVFVIPSGFDVELFADPGPDPFADVPHPRVTFVGRLAHQKGVDVLIEAFASVRHDAHLLVVGDGPLRGDVEEAVRRSPARERIHLVGFVAHEQVPGVLAGADVLVVPSRYEELGSVLVEAVCAGAPIVASAVGGIPTLVEDGVSGRLVPPEDASALAAAIDELLAHPARARAMAERARQEDRARGWDELAERILDVYRAVAS